jgi:hypothetical protein
MNRKIRFEYGFESVNGTVKKVYHLHEIPNIQQKCDVWNILPIKYVRPFTGVNDIIEGDIFKRIDTEETYLVVWNKDCYLARKIYDSWLNKNVLKLNKDCSLNFMTTFKIEKIGDVFNNPELLQVAV